MESDNGMVEGRTAVQTLVFEEFKSSEMKMSCFTKKKRVRIESKKPICIACSNASFNHY